MAIDPFTRGKIANMHAELGRAYAEAGILNEAIELEIEDLESPLYVTIEQTEKETDEVPALDSSKPAGRIEDCVLAYMVSEPEQCDALTIGRLVLGTSGWQVDPTFQPPKSV